MGKASKKKVQAKRISFSWDDLVKARASVEKPIAELLIQSSRIFGILEKHSEEIGKNPDNGIRLKNLGDILTGFFKSIEDIQSDLEYISDFHTKEKINQTKVVGDQEIEVSKRIFLKGNLDLDNDEAGYIKYNHITQAYLHLEGICFEMFSKIIPDLYIRLGELIQDDSALEEMGKLKNNFDTCGTLLTGVLGDSKKELANIKLNLEIEKRKEEMKAEASEVEKKVSDAESEDGYVKGEQLKIVDGEPIVVKD